VKHVDQAIAKRKKDQRTACYVYTVKSIDNDDNLSQEDNRSQEDVKFLDFDIRYTVSADW
jgi:hypothetical protein